MKRMPHEDDYQDFEPEELIPDDETEPSDAVDSESSDEDAIESSSNDGIVIDVEISPEERHQQLKSVAEALIFAATEPLTEAQFLVVVGKRAKGQLADLVEDLNADYARDGRTFEILHVANGFQFFTRTEFAHVIKKLITERSRTRLSRAALESLAVIAFRGPVTRGEIDEIRGVESGGVLRTLLDRRLISVKGRADVVGRPLLYETTDEFLRHFGIADLSELPKHHELTREWGELQETKRQLAANTAKDGDESLTMFSESETSAAAENETGDSDEAQNASDQYDGHNGLAPLNLENKPLDSQQ
jgi:segregation and condensation protein B